MQYHRKEVVVLLAMLISILASSFPLLHILAQTNGSVGLLVTDAIEDLQKGNIEAALVHVNLARQEISPNDNGSTFAVLLDDVINDLEEKDTKKALVHLDLAQRHLGTSISSPSEQQKSPEIIDSKQPTSTNSNDISANYNETQYYCTIEGCGYYQYEVCLDCDEDGDGFPDELFDPRNPSFEGSILCP